MKRIVFDIETMSTFPNAAVIAVGIVVQADGTKASNRLARAWFIDPTMAIGHVNPETMDFWNDQDKETRRVVFGGNETPREVFQSINAWLNGCVGNEEYLCYADPSTFDFPILKSQYQQLGLTQWWHWRTERCAGSIRKHLNEELGMNIEHIKAGQIHHPLHDALAQMDDLQRILVACRQYREGV